MINMNSIENYAVLNVTPIWIFCVLFGTVGITGPFHRG